MKVKVFFDNCPDELEKQVNHWLAETKCKEVVQITTQFGSSLESSQGGTAFWKGVSYITVLYRE